MLMLCYKNGGAVRERLRDEIVGPSWDDFDKALKASAPGNGGLRGLQPHPQPSQHKPHREAWPPSRPWPLP